MILSNKKVFGFFYFYYFKVKPALLEFVSSSPVSQVQE